MFGMKNLNALKKLALFQSEFIFIYYHGDKKAWRDFMQDLHNFRILWQELKEGDT